MVVLPCIVMMSLWILRMSLDEICYVLVWLLIVFFGWIVSLFGTCISTYVFLLTIWRGLHLSRISFGMIVFCELYCYHRTLHSMYIMTPIHTFLNLWHLELWFLLKFKNTRLRIFITIYHVIFLIASLYYLHYVQLPLKN